MKNHLFLLLCLSLLTTPLWSQRKNKKAKATDDKTMSDKKDVMNAGTFSGLKFRNVGPAFSSGRIADIAIHPDDENVWYVAVGSGGVWKTKNAGITWQPLFDSQPVYSTGCITIDPNNPHTIWVGTGENVGGRHVAFGDGIYRSKDGGKSWENMGLKKTEHISEIIIHPENPDVIWVAAQGPLWNKGGERGLYKSTDGGKTWNRTLGNDEWTGVTDIAIDPRNPDQIYAATWDRHRTVAALMGGGPGSGIHRSTDGGETWEQLKTGLPMSNLGKIGIAISPQQPDILYAAIELDRTKGGVYKSTDRGSSWKKMSDAVSGATGPHYYQELYASPHQFDRIYLADVRMQVSDNGGKTFRRMNEKAKHSDNHALAFKMSDPDYLLVGTDGGIYESLDLEQNWRFINNMPITQYYKVAVDDAEPFYNIYGGTQDNGSHGGPSRTDNEHGIRNADWFKTLFADGHQSATEPDNPNIIYAETQQGGLHRVDRITQEQVFIQPQAGAGEDYERFNWDAPIVVSPHDPKRLYFASQRMWRSDNRGDSWTAISEDLTRDEERITLPIMGKQQSWDNPWDVGAMSNYNTITSISESPVQEGLLYAGTDDGIIQVSENGGDSWIKIMAGSISGVPQRAFVNDIKADLHDANTVYVAMDNHKEGDFKPYLYKSTDRGRTWTSISSNLPEKTLVWRVVQDHVKPELMFAATEFGIYFTVNAGKKWTQLKGGVPTISFRDLAIQKRENDLVGASFGRSFFVLDDYSPLREISETTLKDEATLFAVKDAYQYSPRSIAEYQGANEYAAKNPDFGAIFTYYLADGYTTMGAERKKKEKEYVKNKQSVPFPGWDKLEEERLEMPTKIWLTVKDSDGNIVRRVKGKTSKGFHRIPWDLRYAYKGTLKPGEKQRGGSRWQRGFAAAPGTYTVTLSKEENGVITELSEPKSFNVKMLYKGALEGASLQEIASFQKEMEDFMQNVNVAAYQLKTAKDRLAAMQTALERSEVTDMDLVKDVYEARGEVMRLDAKVAGNKSKSEIGERNNPTIRSRMFVGYRGLSTSYGPTENHKAQVKIAKDEFAAIVGDIEKVYSEVVPELEKRLAKAGAPWIEGAE